MQTVRDVISSLTDVDGLENMSTDEMLNLPCIFSTGSDDLQVLSVYDGVCGSKEEIACVYVDLG